MKPTLATVVLGGCTGCHLSLLDAHEKLIDLLGDVELVHSPLIDAEEIPPCDVALVEGAVATEHDQEVVRDVRAKARTLVAVGACATQGGIGGLRNLLLTAEVLRTAYGEEPPPEPPALLDRVWRVSDIVEVDIEVPGCAPLTDTLIAALGAAVAGEPWTAPGRNLCVECGRKHETMLEHSRGYVADSVYGLMELEEIDPERCLLEQGVICMGPMTRQGCEARCPNVNVPCRGCMGASRPEFEQGAKMVDALAAVLPAGALMFLDDLIGTGYRFSLAASVLPAAYRHGGEGDE